MASDESERAIILSGSSSDMVTVIQVPARVVMHNLTEEQIDSLANQAVPINLGFLGLGLGALIGFLTALLAVELSGTTFATFIALFSVSVLTCGYFAIMATKEILQLRSTVKAIKQRGRQVIN